MKSGYGRFFWKLFLGNAVLLIIVAATSVWLILSAFQRLYEDDQFRSLRIHAEVLRGQSSGDFNDAQSVPFQQLADRLTSASDHQIRSTFIQPDGKVLADSHAPAATMNSHEDRPEIRQALREGEGTSTRWSHTLSRHMHYVALRVDGPGGPVGVVRTSLTVSGLADRISAGHELPWIITLVILLTAIVLALGLSRLWSRPIAQINATADNLSRGDLSAGLNLTGTDELGSLARALNQMRDNLAGQLDANYRQRRTLEYLLAQLQEGVVVAGQNGRIMLINPAAARMLGIPVSITSDGRLVDGLTVETCIPQHEVQRMLVHGPEYPEIDGEQSSWGSTTRGIDERFDEQRISIRQSAGSISLLARASDIALPQAGNGAVRPLSVHGSGDEARPDRGRLLVLTDITELTHTLQVKSDFVANASHELRTPLSAIRAAVETLQSLDLAHESAAGNKLLTVVDRHSARLEALVADLLSLSRLESPSAEFEPASLEGRVIFDEIEEQFGTAIRDKELLWDAKFEGDDDTIIANKQLLRLALDNLVENAIKFTDRGGKVTLTGQRHAKGVVLSVEDNGCGIPPEDHARVFERFYQVGRARSGPNRGTGLGLSIVRHAVAGMRGTVDLKSAPGKGTRITLTIPQPATHSD